jgi:tRNA (guanine-N7-)-methyltransferase
VARPARLPAELIQAYLLDVPHPRTPPELWRRRVAELPPGELDWRQVFANDHSVEIEVGFGKGLFLCNESRRRPDTNFLGIEIERKYVMLTAGRLARREAPNVRLACTDAGWLLRERVPRGSVAALHVYFPDPWWKKRHRKRRLLTAEFVEACIHVLAAGGTLNFASDVAEYFAETKAMLDAMPLLRPLSWPADVPEYLTNFERKYRAEGRPIYRARYERLESLGEPPA